MFNYPKDYQKNLEFRADLLIRAEKDKLLQDSLKEASRQDRLFFFNALAWTYNPRNKINGKLVTRLPFITYPFQDKTIIWDAECAENQEDNLVEKSRDMGATWMFIVNDFIDWLFSEEQIEIKWGSRVEDYVDKIGDMQSIFEKIRYLYRNLPPWIMPKGWNASEHDNFMRIINPETGSLLTGESTNPNFARGDRKYRIRFDELAVWKCDQAAWSGTADSTNCRTALSTPNGSSNTYAILAKSNIKKVTLHWTQHPKKNIGAYYLNFREKIPVDLAKDNNRAFELWLLNRDRLAPEPYIGSFMRSPWYDAECARRKKPKEVAQELDIDYHMSGSPFFNLRKLDKQRIWTIIQRETPTNIIPYGRFVRAMAVEIDHKWGIRETEAGWLKVYEYPKPGGQYIVSGDTAEGLEKSDETVGIVQDKYTGNVVAVFNGQYTPDDHATKLFQVGKLYNNSKIAPENNNHGYSVCSDLKQLDCDLYWSFKIDKKTKLRVPTKAGFTTTSESRPAMLDQMSEELDKEAAELRDEDLISQCRTFINNPKGKAEADGDFLDDLIMAKAIGSQVIKDYPYKIPKEKRERGGGRNERPINAGFSFSKD